MVRKRPATISSRPVDDRGRLGNRSPSKNGNNVNNTNNSKSPKIRARTASTNPTHDDTLLPYIVPVRKLTPQHAQKPLSPQWQQRTDQRSPSKKKRLLNPTTSAAGTPQSSRQNDGAAQRGSIVNRSGEGNLAVKAVSAVAAAAAGAAAGGGAGTSSPVTSPRHLPKSPALRGSGSNSSAKRPNPYRRNSAPNNDNNISKVTGNVAKAPKPESPKRIATGEDRHCAAKEVEEELTAEETMLLCGVQPGSSKALWFKSMLRQIDTRSPDGTNPFSAVDGASTIPNAIREPSDYYNNNALTPYSSSGARPFTSPAVRSSAASFLSGPLQLPTELLQDAKNRRRSDRSAYPPCKVTPLPSPPAGLPSSSASLSVASRLVKPLTPQQASRTSLSSPTTKSSDKSDGGDEEISDGEAAAEEEETGIQEKEESSEDQYSPSPTNFGHGTKKPISKAVDSLARQHVVPANRRAEFLPMDVSDAYLRYLRPSRDQLEEFRVHVLSLEQRPKGV